MTEGEALSLLGLIRIPKSKKEIIDIFHIKMTEINNHYYTTNTGQKQDEFDAKKCELINAKETLLNLVPTQQYQSPTATQSTTYQTKYPPIIPFDWIAIKNYMMNLLNSIKVKGLPPNVVIIGSAVLLSSMILLTGKWGIKKNSVDQTKEVKVTKQSIPEKREIEVKNLHQVITGEKPLSAVMTVGKSKSNKNTVCNVEKVSFILVKSYPWARLFIDDIYRGNTPLVKKLEIAPGSHVITLIPDSTRYYSITTEFIAETGQNVILNTDLERKKINYEFQ